MESQLGAAEVCGTGMGLLLAKTPPRRHLPGAVSSLAGWLEEEAALCSLQEKPGTETIKVQRSKGLPRTGWVPAAPHPPQLQQAFFKILQQSDQSSLCSVFPVQLWDPPDLLM